MEAREPSRLLCENGHPIELCTCEKTVDKIVSLRLSCENCQSSKIRSIEGERFCRKHKVLISNKICIDWKPSRSVIKNLLSS